MKQQHHTALPPALATLGLLALVGTAGAQPFTYGTSDLCLTFRNLSSDSYEAVVNLGPASTYANAALGTTNPIAAYSASQITSPTFPSFDNLSWAVVGGYVSGPGYSGYPAYTLWLTVPRDPNNPAIPAAPAVRHYSSEQVDPKLEINSIQANGAVISSTIGTVNPYNTASFVREDTATYATRAMKVFMGSQANPAFGTLSDTWSDNNLEVATPDFFTGSGAVVRSDLYEFRPLDNGHGGAVVDPHTGSSGQAYYVGYFEFTSDGTMTFVRSTGALATPPPPPLLSLSRTNNVNTISFVSSNSSTYTLCFTNETGLSAPVSTWPTGPSLIGNGGMRSLQDTTTDPARFYRVKGQ